MDTIRFAQKQVTTVRFEAGIPELQLGHGYVEVVLYQPAEVSRLDHVPSMDMWVSVGFFRWDFVFQVSKTLNYLGSQGQ